MPRKNPAPVKLICATNRVKAIAIYDCRGHVLLNVEVVVADGSPTTTYYEYSPTGASTSFNAGKSVLKKSTVTYFSYDPSQGAVQRRGYDSAGKLVVWNSSCSSAGMSREHWAPRFGRTVTVVDGRGQMTLRHYLAAPRKAPKAKRSRKKKAARSRRRISRK